MSIWDELMSASDEATGQKVNESVNEGEKPLTPDEQAFRLFEKRLFDIGKQFNVLFTEIKTYKQQKGLR